MSSRSGERTGQFKKVQFQNASNDGYLKFRQNFTVIHFAVIEGATQLVRSSKWGIVKPNGTAGIIAFQLRVSCVRVSLWCRLPTIVTKLTIIEVCQNSGDKDGDTLAVNPGPGFKINAEVLF